MKVPIHNNLVIELHVPDLELAKKFYGTLGFVVTMDNKSNDKELGCMTMTRVDEKEGRTMINFYGGDERVYGQSWFKQWPKDTKRGYAISVTIPVSDIDALYATATKELRENVVREIKEIKDHYHHWKDFRMVDPFGFYLRFTELLDWGQE